MIIVGWSGFSIHGGLMQIEGEKSDAAAVAVAALGELPQK